MSIGTGTRWSAVVALALAGCSGGAADPPAPGVPTVGSTLTTTTTPAPAATTTSAPETTDQGLDAIDVAAVAGLGEPCANVAALDGTVRPVFAWDCPLTSASWPDADYRVKGRRGVLGWLYEDDPDGMCGFPNHYYECHSAPMRATVGGVLLSLATTDVEIPVWDEGDEAYRPLEQQLWTATFYLGDHPGSAEPIVGEFLLSAPGLAPDGEANPSRWRVCLLGNLLGGGEVSCLQAPPREISPGRLALQVLEVGRAYAFTVFYTFDPDEVFGNIDPRYTVDESAWGRVVNDWVSRVEYARHLRREVQGEPGGDAAGPGLIMDLVLDAIPDQAA